MHQLQALDLDSDSVRQLMREAITQADHVESLFDELHSEGERTLAKDNFGVTIQYRREQNTPIHEGSGGQSNPTLGKVLCSGKWDADCPGKPLVVTHQDDPCTVLCRGEWHTDCPGKSIVMKNKEDACKVLCSGKWDTDCPGISLVMTNKEDHCKVLGGGQWNTDCPGKSLIVTNKEETNGSGNDQLEMLSPTKKMQQPSAQDAEPPGTKRPKHQ